MTEPNATIDFRYEVVDPHGGIRSVAEDDFYRLSLGGGRIRVTAGLGTPTMRLRPIIRGDE